MTLSPARRRAILAVLALVVLACLATVVGIVATRSAGDSLSERLRSLKDDEVPASAATKEREELLALSRDFAARFNTYGPSMLDEEGRLPEYTSVTELMTPKFAGVFEEAAQLPEQTVAQLGASSEAAVYAVGVASQDGDSADVLVAGTIELSYAYPEGEGNGRTPGKRTRGEDDPRVSTGPQVFRWEISLVKIEGEWLVDDVDDIDDGRPPFSQPAIPEEPTAPSPTDEPSTEGDR